MAARGGHEETQAGEARQEVLSSPELVERVLAQLEAPTLILGTREHYSRGTKRAVGDRWTASHVSRTFRAAALRLPWRAELSDCNRTAVSRAATAWCRGRAVNYLRLSLERLTPAAKAALLCCGPGLETLELSVAQLLPWLQASTIRVQAAAAEGPVERVPLLTYLSSLTRLRVLRVVSTRAWHDASWLTALPQLTSVLLYRFKGAPVGGLPHLGSLCLQHGNPTQGPSLAEGALPEVSLEQWAGPRLTSLYCMFHAVLLGFPPCAPSAQAWLRGLQTLELYDCHLKLHTPSLREVLPCLTALVITYEHDLQNSNSCIDGVLSGGLPLGLVHLRLEQCAISAPEQPWVALSGLTRMEYMVVSRLGMFLGVYEADLAIAALSPMLRLRRALLVLTTDDPKALEEHFSDLEARMAARGTDLHIGYIVRVDPGQDGDSVPSDEYSDSEMDPEEDFYE